MRCRQLQAPRIRKRVSGFGAQDKEQWMRQGHHLFLLLLAFRPEDELDVYCVGMTDRDARLQPAKFNLPDTPERVGPGFKTTQTIHRFKGSKTKCGLFPLFFKNSPAQPAAGKLCRTRSLSACGGFGTRRPCAGAYGAGEVISNCALKNCQSGN